MLHLANVCHTGGDHIIISEISLLLKQGYTIRSSLYIYVYIYIFVRVIKNFTNSICHLSTTNVTFLSALGGDEAQAALKIPDLLITAMQSQFDARGYLCIVCACTHNDLKPHIADCCSACMHAGSCSGSSLSTQDHEHCIIYQLI